MKYKYMFFIIASLIISSLYTQDFTFTEFIDTWEGTSSSQNYYEWNTDLTIVVESDGFYTDSSGLLMPPYYYPNTQMCEFDAATNRLHFWYLNTVYAGQYFYTHNYFEVVYYDGVNLELHYNFWDDPEPHPNVWTISLTRAGGIPTGILEGIVIDADTFIALENFMVTAGNSSAETDEEGYFSIELEQGIYDVVISHVGYEDKVFDDLYIPAGIETNLSVNMQHLYEPPLELTYQIAAPSLILGWIPPPGPSLTEYRIYRDYQQLDSTSNLYYIENDLPAGVYSYFVTAAYGEYESEPSEMVLVEISGTDSNSDQINPATVLRGNYPNPFNPETTISFSLAEAAPVQLVIYNIKGEKVKTLINSRLGANNYNIVWNGRDDDNRKLAGGFYMYKLKAGLYTDSKKMIMMK